jgi:hypothetical protein
MEERGRKYSWRRERKAGQDRFIFGQRGSGR